jgi:nicotinate phosphoribosyltransferase
MRLAAPGKTLIDFGFRRAHGAEAGLMGARASWIAGFDGTATVLAGRRFGIPLSGTMAHALVQAFGDETAAFEAFARSRPDNVTLLIDTYDTLAAARKVAALAPRLAAAGVRVAAVRLDSGDLVALSRGVRAILDEAGQGGIRIIASGGLDEDDLAAFAAAGAPIDGYGLGTAMTTSSDVPSLDCVYKLEEFDGRPRRKRSTGKATWPGRKQVWRRFAADGAMQGDTVGLDGEAPAGAPLLAPVMRGGRRLAPSPPLAQARAHAAAQLAALPEPLRRLDPGHPYPVAISPALRALAAEFDAASQGPAS